MYKTYSIDAYQYWFETLITVDHLSFTRDLILHSNLRDLIVIREFKYLAFISTFCK
jgi:hypothetical protein